MISCAAYVNLANIHAFDKKKQFFLLKINVDLDLVKIL